MAAGRDGRGPRGCRTRSGCTGCSLRFRRADGCPRACSGGAVRRPGRLASTRASSPPRPYTQRRTRLRNRRNPSVIPSVLLVSAERAKSPPVRAECAASKRGMVRGAISRAIRQRVRRRQSDAPVRGEPACRYRLCVRDNGTPMACAFPEKGARSTAAFAAVRALRPGGGAEGPSGPPEGCRTRRPERGVQPPANPSANAVRTAAGSFLQRGTGTAGREREGAGKDRERAGARRIFGGARSLSCAAQGLMKAPRRW